MSKRKKQNIPSESRGLSKEELESEKLQLEIKQLREHWWQKPSYVLAALPTLLAIISLIYGLSNGYFQALAMKLEIDRGNLQSQKSNLEQDIKNFTSQKEELRQTIANLENERSERQASIDNLLVVQEELKGQNDKLQSNIKGLEGRLVISTFEAYLDAVKRSPEIINSQEAHDLANILYKSGPERSRYIELLKGILNSKESSSTLRGTVLQIMYNGTGDSIWLEQFLTLLRNKITVPFKYEETDYLMQMLYFFELRSEEDDSRLITFLEQIRKTLIQLRKTSDNMGSSLEYSHIENTAYNIIKSVKSLRQQLRKIK